jgi:hypothetical protein
MPCRPLQMLLMGILLASTARADDVELGFVPLFIGKTLDGWKVVGGGARYQVEDGEIVVVVDPGSRLNRFLRTEKTYGDFIGIRSAEIVDPKGWKRGKLALQLHGGQDVDVRFKDISILPIVQGK